MQVRGTSVRARGARTVRRRRVAAAVIAGLAVVPAVGAVNSTAQNPVPDPIGSVVNPEWGSNTIQRALARGASNNVVDGAIAARDDAVKDWKSASAATRSKHPLARPEYSVVWMGKQSGADISGKQLMQLAGNGTLNPEGLLQFAQIEFAPGLDGFAVIDVRKEDIKGEENPDYGNVVNFVQLPAPWSIACEPHHMQYDWFDGDPIIAGCLFNSAAFVMDPSDVPKLELKNTITPDQVPLGSIFDAFDASGKGTFIGTQMGGPLYNFGGSPGALVTFKADAAKGAVVASETPAGSIGGINTGNTSSNNSTPVPEPCTMAESRPLGTCANPHGIQARPDLGYMVTSDYAEPRELVLDPIKVIDQHTFRPTVRTWDITNPIKPILKSVAKLPCCSLDRANTGHNENLGMMETAKTYGKSKAAFTGSMCGGGIFFAPDITKLRGDASGQWQEVWNDGISELRGEVPDANGVVGEQVDEPGGCEGGAWHQVSPDNKWFFRAVQGRLPLSDNFGDSGSYKYLYSIDISPLIASAEDGKVECDLVKGVDINDDGKIGRGEKGADIFNKLAQGRVIADCPKYIDVLPVHDKSTGGPHWAALDNHSMVKGSPRRLLFSDYFVARTGVDGNHRMYMANISKDGKLSYDKTFRDNTTAALGITFNRRNWPGSPNAGFYKPHSMIWVCPPGVC